MDSDAEHTNSCEDQHCVRCQVNRRWKIWKNMFGWAALARPKNKRRCKVWVGCTACAAKGAKTPMARMRATPKLSNLKRHSKHPAHMANAHNVKLKNKIASPNCAPAKSEFEEVWKDVRSGKAVLRSKRTKKIAYSLQEAVKTKRQRLVLQAKGGTLFRDESKNRLSCRLRVVNKQFQRSTFHLGNKRDPGYGAGALTNATEHIMKTFSTRFANAPLTKVRSVFKADVYKSLQDHIFAVCTDAAADELLSAKMMQVPPLREQDGVAALLPKFRFTIRDTAHAARRIISRPWAASPKLKHAAGVFGRYSHSLGQRVHHSPKYRSVFKKWIKVATHNAKHRVASMRAAKHRLETFAKPAGRTVIFFSHHCSVPWSCTTALMISIWSTTWHNGCVNFVMLKHV